MIACIARDGAEAPAAARAGGGLLVVLLLLELWRGGESIALSYHGLCCCWLNSNLHVLHNASLQFYLFLAHLSADVYANLEPTVSSVVLESTDYLQNFVIGFLFPFSKRKCVIRAVALIQKPGGGN